MKKQITAIVLIFVTALLLGAYFYRPNRPSRSSASDLTKVKNLYALDGKQRGVSWVAGAPVTEADFLPLVKDHVEWIVQTPFGWQDNSNSPEVRLVTRGRIFWGERDDGLATTSRLAKQFGIRTLLKPHIWLRNSNDGKWRGEISMDSETDWQKWFDSYRTFILHYAELAERNQMEALCIGTELRMTVRAREQDWRKLIGAVRQVYGGKLTYASNWYLEFEEVPFWDALDYIGIQAYFPLTDKTRPSVEELKAGWQPHLEAIETISRKFNKPVLFTELGYRSTPDAAIEPWHWPEFMARSRLQVDLQTQLKGYEAFFEMFWHKDWFEGVYFWKWFPNYARAGGSEHVGFSPQNKPAEQTMAKWYDKVVQGN